MFLHDSLNLFTIGNNVKFSKIAECFLIVKSCDIMNLLLAWLRKTKKQAVLLFHIGTQNSAFGQYVFILDFYDFSGHPTSSTNGTDARGYSFNVEMTEMWKSIPNGSEK